MFIAKKQRIITFAIIFAAIGVIAIIITFAGSSFVSHEAEDSASLTGGTSIKTDANASENQFVEFPNINEEEPVGDSDPEDTWFGYEKPGPDNTGPTTPNSLTSMGSTNIKTDGAVLEGFNMTGVITVSADNVTIRNFKISATGTYAINISSGTTGTVIEDGEISNMSSAAILGSNFTAKRLNIHDSDNDGIKPYNNAVIESNWIHGLGRAEGSHADVVQMVSGGDVIMRGNFCDIPTSEPDPYKGNACAIIQTNNAPIDNVVIEYNWVNGGNYSFFIKDKGNGYGAPTNVSVSYNRFGREYRYGLYSTDGVVTKVGNVWDDDDTDANSNP